MERCALKFRNCFFFWSSRNYKNLTSQEENDLIQLFSSLPAQSRKQVLIQIKEDQKEFYKKSTLYFIPGLITMILGPTTHEKVSDDTSRQLAYGIGNTIPLILWYLSGVIIKAANAESLHRILTDQDADLEAAQQRNRDQVSNISSPTS